jgi:glucosamine--fructose-6-phosphate aminotransferase (isomerizing)
MTDPIDDAPRSPTTDPIEDAPGSLMTDPGKTPGSPLTDPGETPGSPLIDPGDEAIPRRRKEDRVAPDAGGTPDPAAAPGAQALDTAAPAFGPDRPLPGPPDPWQPSTMPPVRAHPPYVMTQMIDAEPALAERLVGRLSAADAGTAELAAAISEAAGLGQPIVVTGCGTSEHAAQAIVEVLREAMLRADLPDRLVAAQAFEASLAPQRSGLLIAVSHEGGTWATNQALAAAREAGARTALISVGRGSPAARLAELVVATGEQDQGWCHTVGYLSPIVAGAVVGAALTGDRLDGTGLRGLLSECLRLGSAAEDLASALTDVTQLLVVASGADRPAARELALKVEEAAHLPTIMRDLETLLHGHLPATDRDTGLVLILADRSERAARLERAWQALSAVGAIGLRAGAIVAQEVDRDLDPGLTPIGRLVAPEATDLTPPVAALLGTAIPLQLLTERLARARGTNPDTLRRTDERYRGAADLYD